MLPPLPAQDCPNLPALPITQPGCPGPAAGEGCSSSSIVLPERESSGIVQPLAASPQISSPGAWPPGSALTCHVDVASEALCPLGKGCCEQSPHSGHRKVPEGQGAGSMGRMVSGTSGARLSGIQINFWVQKALSPTGLRTRRIWVPHKYKGLGSWVVSQLLCRRDAKAGPGGASLSQKGSHFGLSP